MSINPEKKYIYDIHTKEIVKLGGIDNHVYPVYGGGKRWAWGSIILISDKEREEIMKETAVPEKPSLEDFLKMSFKDDDKLGYYSYWPLRHAIEKFMSGDWEQAMRWYLAQYSGET